MSEETRMAIEPPATEETDILANLLLTEGHTEQSLVRPAWTWRRPLWLILSLLGIIVVQQVFLLRMSSELSEQAEIRHGLVRLLLSGEVEDLDLMDRAAKVTRIVGKHDE